MESLRAKTNFQLNMFHDKGPQYPTLPALYPVLTIDLLAYVRAQLMAASIACNGLAEDRREYEELWLYRVRARCLRGSLQATQHAAAVRVKEKSARDWQLTVQEWLIACEAVTFQEQYHSCEVPHRRQRMLKSMIPAALDKVNCSARSR